MTDTTTGTPVADALIAAKVHAQNSWYLFTGQKDYDAIVPSWKVGDTEDGSPCLSSEVVGESAAHALRRFARDFHLTLPHPGDVHPQFDIHAPVGRTALVWRYDGVWVELWHPDSLSDAPEGPEPVRGAPVPSVAAQSAPPSSPAVRHAFLRRPSARLPFTRRKKETPTV